MRLGIVFGVVAVVIILGGLAVAGVWWFAIADRYGVELTYRMLSQEPPTDPTADRVVEILQKRLRHAGWGRARVSRQGTFDVVARVPGATQADLPALRELLGRPGQFALRDVADREVHEAYDGTHQVPAGFEAMPVPPRSHIQRETLLVRVEPVVTAADLKTAEHEYDARYGNTWRVLLEMQPAGAQRWDAAAARLFRQEPHGQIAIVVDGRLVSAPIVMAEAFGGYAEISGSFSESEAGSLAIALRSGELRAAIGRVQNGVPQPGRPVREAVYGDK